MKAQLQARGETLDDMDLQIASIALEHDSPLFTHNPAIERLAVIPAEGASHSRQLKTDH